MEKETNLEHYLKRLKRVMKEAYDSPKLIFNGIQKYMDPEIKHTNVEYTNDILDWMAQEYKEEILDYAEKRYLSKVIRPFRKEVIAIEKSEAPAGEEYIWILFKDDCMRLPCFKKDTMYKGMKPEKTYKPEELGL